MINLRLLVLAMLAPLVFLTACGSGGGTSGTSMSSGVSLAASDNAKITTVASTVPANGDVNPYGVAIVGQTVGNLKAGDILVSNFNNSANLQGTGSTIVDVAANGSVSLFAHLDAGALPGACPGGVGLTTALVALRSGWVIVGSLPTTDGTAATAQAGCLIVLDSIGNPVETISGAPINGPWDMTAFEDGNGAKLFVTNVLNGTVKAKGKTVNKGTVVRIDLQIAAGSIPKVESITIIGSGFPERTDPAALVIGPTGLGLSPDGQLLYVADSLSNRIATIATPLTAAVSAGTGTTLTSGGSLNDPLGLTVDDGTGNIFTVNGNDGFLTVIDPQGVQVATKLLDSSGSPPGAGALFGLALGLHGGLYFVDDATNTLNLLH
jgi:DNA-binding beta-propeller fold protein YncE